MQKTAVCVLSGFVLTLQAEANGFWYVPSHKESCLGRFGVTQSQLRLGFTEVDKCVATAGGDV